MTLASIEEALPNAEKKSEKSSSLFRQNFFFNSSRYERQKWSSICDIILSVEHASKHKIILKKNFLKWGSHPPLPPSSIPDDTAMRLADK